MEDGNIMDKSSGIQNPYLLGSEGRKEWNDRYDNLSKSVKSWRMAFFAAILISIIFAIALAKIATESRVQPFVVETTNGMPYAIKHMDQWSLQDQRIINFALNQFIINARTIVNDDEAETALLNKVYAFSANNTINYLRDYFEKNNPLELGSKYTVTVKVVNTLPISHNTWQITWDETKRDASGGNIVGVTRWMANLTYRFGEVNQKFITDNPFGFYVTDLSISQNQIS